MINESNIKEQTIEINGTLVCISVRHFSNRQNTYAIITGLSQESTLWQQTNSKKVNYAAMPPAILLTILLRNRRSCIR